MSYSNLTVILNSSIRAIVWEHVADQMRLNVVILQGPETIANIVDTLNVVKKMKTDIFHIHEELRASAHLKTGYFK